MRMTGDYHDPRAKIQHNPRLAGGAGRTPGPVQQTEMGEGNTGRTGRYPPKTAIFGKKPPQSRVFFFAANHPH
jgi:hypothetical protein